MSKIIEERLKFVEKYFGKIPDTEIAEVCNVSTPVVLNARKNLGIPKVEQRNSGHRSGIWQPKLSSIIFDNFTDEEIAREFNIRLPVVVARREFFEEFYASEQPPWVYARSRETQY